MCCTLETLFEIFINEGTTNERFGFGFVQRKVVDMTVITSTQET